MRTSGQNMHIMAYRKRTTNRPNHRRDIPQDASRDSRFDYDGYYDYGLEDDSLYEESPYRMNANQYSRYNAESYASRRDERASGFDGYQRNDSDYAYESFDNEFDYGERFTSDDQSSSYARGSAGRYAAGRKRRRRRRIIRRAIIAIVALLLVGAGSAFAYVNMLNNNLSRGLDSDLKDQLVKTNLTKEPFYMLLLGTDASLERENDETYGESFRTDTIVLARVDPVEGKVTLVSMPRDTMIESEYDGDGNAQKINAMYAVGGASKAVKTVSSISGKGISHFLLVDMDGLTNVVDALGGIEVDVPITIDDEDAGGHLDAGLQTLNGEQALILCRSRNAFEEYGGGDIYRAANQRLVLQAIASKVLSSDIGTIATTVTDLTNYVSTDLSVNDIVGLAQAFQGMDVQNSIYTGSMPTESSYINEIWYEVIIDSAWQAMMARVDQGLPPEESTITDDRIGLVLSNSGDAGQGGSLAGKKDMSVAVRNGTDVDGAGSGAAGVLQKAGYGILDVKGADAVDYSQTLVIYNDSSQQITAEEIAKALGDNVQIVLNDGSYAMVGDFLVVVGSDMAEALSAYAEDYSGDVVSDDTAALEYTEEYVEGDTYY